MLRVSLRRATRARPTYFAPRGRGCPEEDPRTPRVRREVRGAAPAFWTARSLVLVRGPARRAWQIARLDPVGMAADGRRASGTSRAGSLHGRPLPWLRPG